jgi:S-methylmethionine-dependent homocysteine/selenocysteine methylase
VRYVGGCCGTGPSDIADLATRVEQLRQTDAT